MQVTFINIRWDTDGEKVDLPERVEISVPDDWDVANQGADFLSDKYGYCVHGFDFISPQRLSTEPHELTVQDMRTFLQYHGAKIPAKQYRVDQNIGRPIRADLLQYIEAVVENDYWGDDAVVVLVSRNLGNPFMAFSAPEVEQLIKEKFGDVEADAISRVLRDAVSPERGQTKHIARKEYTLALKRARDCKPLPGGGPEPLQLYVRSKTDGTDARKTD